MATPMKKKSTSMAPPPPATPRAKFPDSTVEQTTQLFLVFRLILLTQVRRLEEVVDQLENWFALRNSAELDDLCLEVGWFYHFKLHITLKSQENVLVKKTSFQS